MGKNGIIYIGTVTRVSGAKVYVSVSALGEDDDEFGPLNVLVPVLTDPTVVSTSHTVSGTTGPGGGDSHTHSFSDGSHTHTTNVGDMPNDYYVKGDKVVVAQVGLVKEDLIVLGKVA